jgi:hypothetical protein
MARLKSRVEAQKLHLAATSDRPTADDDRLAKLMNRALKGSATSPPPPRTPQPAAAPPTPPPAPAPAAPREVDRAEIAALKAALDREADTAAELRRAVAAECAAADAAREALDGERAASAGLRAAAARERATADALRADLEHASASLAAAREAAAAAAREAGDAREAGAANDDVLCGALGRAVRRRRQRRVAPAPGLHALRLDDLRRRARRRGPGARGVVRGRRRRRREPQPADEPEPLAERELRRLSRTREIQRRFNVSVPRARVPGKASTLRDRSKR